MFPDPLFPTRRLDPLRGLFASFAPSSEEAVNGGCAYDGALDHYRMTSAGSAVGARQILTGNWLVRAEGRIESGSGPLTARWRVRPVETTQDVADSSGNWFAPSDAELTLRTEFSVLQLEREGDVLRWSGARFGEPLTLLATAEVSVDSALKIELGCVGGTTETAAVALFRNVRMVSPAPSTLVPYRDYLGSRLEILDVVTGQRDVVHTVEDSLQAPNWTPDGRHLIYNRNGLLYRFNLFSHAVSELPTDFARQHNNDHVLSPDGSQLVISHHAADAEGQSIVYTVPTLGGVPRRITEQGPSYAHGWSPDGRYLVFTGGRDGVYSIYRIPVEGGAEEALTTGPALDDGAEYSPDGRFIYFNSVRTGAMQLWRMGADGGDPVQLTNDGFHDWFPHCTPDGRELVFISYRIGDIEPSDHPFYRQVYLRMMPVDGSAPPRVVAYLYGGQGTINVPSWSPDGRHLAFVSNTGVADDV